MKREVSITSLFLVLMLLSVIPASATPISDFPAPFVQGGTIYATNGTPTMAIVIGSKAATWDMLGAAMLAAKIGSHLYYSNASWVDVDDAAAHGITLYYGGFSADEYYIHKSITELINSTLTSKLAPVPLPLIGPNNPYGDVVGSIYNLGGEECNLDHDVVLVPLDNVTLNPARFHYLLGINASIEDIHGVVYDPSTGVFYLNTGLVALQPGVDVNIPWIGFKLHVYNVKFRDATHPFDRALVMMENNEGVTVAYLNISASPDGIVIADFVFNPDDPAYIGDQRVNAVGNYHMSSTGHAGVPEFKIDMTVHPERNWIPLPEFNVILANFTSASLPQYALSEGIYAEYGDPWLGSMWSTAITPGWLHNVTYPVEAPALTINNTWYGGNITYIWSPDVFPWFNGRILAYVWDFTTGTPFYVFNKNDSWYFNETKHLGCYDYLFSSIGNYTKTPESEGCPLTATLGPAVNATCVFICGDYAGVYRINSSDELVHALLCKYLTNTSSGYPLANKTNSYGAIGMAYEREESVVYARHVSGVFAGIFDRFEDKSGKWTGTTVLTFNSSGGVVWAEDHTPAEYKDQVYSGEDVFSFVKMPIIYLDSWVFVNDTLTSAVKDKNLILIGGPAVNSVVKYLNDAGLLPVKFVFNGSVAALSYEGKTYDLDTVLQILVNEGILPAPISKEYVYRVEGGNGLGVIEYATSNPFGSGQILVVAGTDRYGTLAASVALADPTKLASSTAEIFYNAGRGGNVNAVILLGIQPTMMPVKKPVPTLTPVVVAIPPSAAGS